MELCAIVDCDGLEQVPLLADQLDDACVELCLRVVGEIADQDAPGSTLDERDDAMFAAGAANRVHLPVAELAPPLDGGRLFGNVSLASQAAALLVSAVTLAVLSPLAQVTPQLSAVPLVAPDVLIDRFVADPEEPDTGQKAADLLRAKVCTERCSTIASARA